MAQPFPFVSVFQPQNNHNIISNPMSRKTFWKFQRPKDVRDLVVINPNPVSLSWALKTLKDPKALSTLKPLKALKDPKALKKQVPSVHQHGPFAFLTIICRWRRGTDALRVSGLWIIWALGCTLLGILGS